MYKTTLYQEYQCKTIPGEAMTRIKILSHPITIGQKHMEHLKEVMICPVKTEKNRFILIADNMHCGYQAATLLLYRILQLDKTTEIALPDEDDLDRELNELLLDFNDPADYEDKAYDSSRDILIENADVFSTSGTGFEQQEPMAVQRQMISLDRISKAANLLLHCNRNIQDKEEVLEGITNHLEGCDNMFLLIPRNNVSNHFVEHLVFQYGFKVCTIKEPSLAQLHSLFLDLAPEAGLVIKEEVQIKDVIQKLKCYRTAFFWEKDLERLILAVKQKVNEKQAGKEDFNLYYYNGEKKSGEEQLRELIGQEKAKEDILRITALMRYTMKLREKYEDKTEFYHNFCFAGPPGTGKTQMARIAAKILEEYGISNGKYKEVSKEHLTAGYLGQTPIKIAKLFDEVRGGVLFIDEAGSLVTDDRDSYTKEAISALVRHMENDSSTTVILATYQDEMDRLLSSDPGLKSRITRVINFQPYSQEEFWKIFCFMAGKNHLTVDKDAQEEVYRYINLCADNNPGFGNAREMRKLLQASMEELSIRSQLSTEALEEVITGQDVKKAGAGLIRKENYRLPTIGFSIPVSQRQTSSVGV